MEIDTLIAMMNEILQTESITADSTIEMIDEWDSLGHLQLILGLEEKLGIKFNTAIIPTLISVHKIHDAINQFYRSN